MIGGWIGLHLLYLSWEDLRERELSMMVVAELGGTGALYCLLTGNAPCLLPGVLFLFFGFVTDEAVGYGDGWLILALGLWMSAEELLSAVFLGMILGSGFAICFGKKEIPFVPFLGAAYVVGRWLR